MERRLAAILAADVAGYSRLIGLDEEGTLRRFQALRQDVLDPLISRYRGRIVKLMGDGLLVEFHSVVDAVECAAAWQRQVADHERDLTADRRFTFRIGINLGDVMVEGHDIHGDGVNIASRLEALAAPGGVAVSGMVHQNVRSKVDIAFEDLGEQKVKNIAEPIRVFQIAGAGVSGIAGGGESLPRGAKPTIAVLPFDNLSSDVEQLYFSDGFTEDIITELSRFRQLSVISRNSSFQFRGKATDVRHIARMLGVQFVVEGSVRRAGDRVRIAAQLIDAGNDNHLWAERFDRNVSNLFDVQDEVVQAIVARVAVQLRTAEQERASRLRPENMAAYDCFLRGLGFLRSIDTDSTMEAHRWFEAALQHDPNYAAAMAGLAQCLCQERASSSSDEPLGRALALASRAVELDPNDGFTHSTLGVVHIAGLPAGYGSIRSAIDEAETALQLNPNDADHIVRRALLHTYSGRPELALPLIDRAERLNPILPGWYLSNRGFALFGLHRYEEAAAMFERVAKPAHWDHYYLAACYGYLGRLPEARRRVATAMESVPNLSLGYIARYEWYTDQADRDHLVNGLRIAGMPE